MLINMRNAMLAGAALPYDAEVEYLQSTGTQWIDTGVTPTPSDTTRIVTNLVLTTINTTDNNILFGSYTDTIVSSYQSRQFAFVDASAKCRIAYGTAASGTVSVSAGSSCQYDAQFKQGDSNVSVNGTLSSQSATTPSALPLQPMSLFAARYKTSSVISPSKMQLKSCKIYLNAALVRDFIPVRFTNENSVTEGATYDRVSGQLFRNAGTGAFLYGTDI